MSKLPGVDRIINELYRCNNKKWQEIAETTQYHSLNEHIAKWMIKNNKSVEHDPNHPVNNMGHPTLACDCYYNVALTAIELTRLGQGMQLVPWPHSPQRLTVKNIMETLNLYSFLN